MLTWAASSTIKHSILFLNISNFSDPAEDNVQHIISASYKSLVVMSEYL